MRALPRGTAQRLAQLLQDLARPRFVVIAFEPKLRGAFEERNLPECTGQGRIAHNAGDAGCAQRVGPDGGLQWMIGAGQQLHRTVPDVHERKKS